MTKNFTSQNDWVSHHKQRDGGSAMAAARRLRRWWQRDVGGIMAIYVVVNK
jgi:hypothetical protein